MYLFWNSLGTKMILKILPLGERMVVDEESLSAAAQQNWMVQKEWFYLASSACALEQFISFTALTLLD